MEFEKLHGNVERWLVHSNYKFEQVRDQESIFHVSIRHVGAFGNAVDIFQPSNQKNVLVIGSKIPLKNNQNARYLKLNDFEKENFESKISNYCNSIKAIYKPHIEEGKKKVGVYVVLDKEDQFNQQSFLDVIDQVAEMGDKMAQFLIKVF